MLGEDNFTAIIVAILSGAIPGFFALRQSHKTKKSVELAGSEITVNNWNKLIANLYGEIDRLTQSNERERKRFAEREHELMFELEAARITAAKEKAVLLDEIKALRQKLSELEDRVSRTLEGDTNRAVQAQADNEQRTKK